MSAETLLYRLCSVDEWHLCQSSGQLPPNEDDIRDGFLHLSTMQQVKGTALKYYTDVPGLLVLGISANDIEPVLKWERSRGGMLFPHVYGPLPLSAILFAKTIPRHKNRLQFPAELFA